MSVCSRTGSRLVGFCIRVKLSEDLGRPQPAGKLARRSRTEVAIADSVAWSSE